LNLKWWVVGCFNNLGCFHISEDVVYNDLICSIFNGDWDDREELHTTFAFQFGCWWLFQPA
jgi:hypothetical protein